MHYRAEIILPTVSDVETAISEIMEPFQEGAEEGCEEFWDFWVIGGRFSGDKLLSSFDKDKLDEFYKELNKRKFTVSGLTCGKQRLQPENQIPAVDDLWNEFFPNSGLKACPTFAHFNDQYKNSNGWPDIMKVSELTETMTADRLIFARFSDFDKKYEAQSMYQESFWNGCSHLKTCWNGNILEALEKYKIEHQNATDEWKEKVIPKDDWICVSVDYHN